LSKNDFFEVFIMVRAHKKHTKSFDEETYSEQARTINASMIYLGKEIKANIKRALSEGKKNPKERRIRNLENLIERIRAYNP
jgi:hypothetical protein